MRLQSIRLHELSYLLKSYIYVYDVSASFSLGHNFCLLIMNHIDKYKITTNGLYVHFTFGKVSSFYIRAGIVWMLEFSKK